VDVSKFDAVIAVIGETPYAEGDGDIGPAGTLRLSGRHPKTWRCCRPYQARASRW
jgi:beta-glucosidase